MKTMLKQVLVYVTEDNEEFYDAEEARAHELKRYLMAFWEREYYPGIALYDLVDICIEHLEELKGVLSCTEDMNT